MNNRSNAVPAMNAAAMNARRANNSANSMVNARTRNGVMNAVNRVNAAANAANMNAYRANIAAKNNPTVSNMNAARKANMYALKANQISNAIKKLKNMILNYKMR